MKQNFLLICISILLLALSILGLLYYNANSSIQTLETKLENERKKLSDYVYEQTLNQIENFEEFDKEEYKFESKEDNTYLLMLDKDNDFYYNLYKRNDKEQLETIDSEFDEGFYIEGENIDKFIYDERNRNLYYSSRYINAITPGYDYLFLYMYDLDDATKTKQTVDFRRVTYNDDSDILAISDEDIPSFVDVEKVDLDESTSLELETSQ